MTWLAAEPTFCVPKFNSVPKLCSMCRFLLILYIILCPVLTCLAKEKDKDAAIRKEIEKENDRYQRNLAKYPNKAATYRDHARIMTGFHSECRDARVFYEKALTLDSTDASLFREYGEYLFDKLMDINGSKSALTMCVKLSKEDDEIHKYLTQIDRITEAREKETKLRDFGHTKIRELGSATVYASITNMDSLRKVAADTSSRFCYGKLLARFLTDDPTLAPEEVYMLIIGYSATPDYNPFNYNDISSLKMVSAINSDTAISKGMAMIPANPLNPSLNREIMYSYRRKNDLENAARFERRIHQFFNGVLYSGNGNCTRPYVSLWGKEEYNFLNYLDYKQTENHSMETCAGQLAEKIEIIDAKTGQSGNIYFNVKLIYMQTTGK